MKSLITRRRVIVFIVVIGLLYYLSKPDRGGVAACSKVFGLPELQTIKMSSKSFWSWELFESPKYRFSISPKEYTKLKSVLAEQGYSDWVRQGLTYDSVNIGTENYEDCLVSKKQGRGTVFYWSYSRKLGEVYAISWNH